MNSRLTSIVWAVATFALLTGIASSTQAGLPPEVPESAHGTGSVDEGNPRVETRLIVDKTGVEPGGKMRAGVHFAIDPDWHIYWRNSGDAGMATEVRWGGDTFEFGDLEWPAPAAHEEGEGQIVTFGYDDEVVLFAPVTVAEDAGGTVELRAEVDYLACKVDCIPGSATMTRKIDVGESAKPASKKERELLDRFASRLPQKAESLGVRAEVVYSQKPIRPGDTFRAGIGLDFCAEGPNSCRPLEVVGSVDSHEFIPDTTAQVEWKTLDVREHPGAKAGAVLILEGKAGADDPRDDERLSGVVHLVDEEDESSALLVDAPLPRGGSGAEVETLEPALLEISGAPEPEENSTEAAASIERSAQGDSGAGGSGIGFFRALLFAFLGGMILNLMPCVFPVLALKVTSFAELVHEDRSHALLHGAAYAGGIVGSMLVLAGVVLGLRMVGTEVGWGFQFQNPVFPAVLAVVVVVFALNLFGVFEIHVSASKLADTTRKSSGLRRSLGEGVLAVVLATPCSAPFLGTGVGFALAGSAATVVVIFAALGLGLAAPFVVLMLVPGWSKVLPDPGPWMVQIRQFLGFALVGAAVWLVWVVGRSTGVDGMAQLLTFLGAVSFAVWVYGAAQQGEISPGDLVFGVALALVGWGAWVGWQMLPERVLVRVAAAVPIVSVVAAIAVGGRRLGVRFAGAALGIAVSVAIAVGAWALDFERTGSGGAVADSSSESSEQGGIDWEPWSEKEVKSALEDGTPVFVDFTADWCITCKVNERTVLSTERVRTAMERHEVTTMKADWTDGDERIRKKLESFGKSGVPLYLVYNPKQPEEPAVLPEVLTPSRVVGAIEDASPGSSDDE